MHVYKNGCPRYFWGSEIIPVQLGDITSLIVKLILNFCIVFLGVIYIFAYKLIYLGKDIIASTSVLLNLSYCLSSRSGIFQVQNRYILFEYILMHRASNELRIPIGYTEGTWKSVWFCMPKSDCMLLFLIPGFRIPKVDCIVYNLCRVISFNIF